VGIERVHGRILELKRAITGPLLAAGFEFIGPLEGPNASAITTFHHPGRDSNLLFQALEQNHIVASLRFDRAGAGYIRLSPHFYNTLDEVGRVVEILLGNH
jgi:selenocysteine lyase/cysteine desulfurase